MFKEPVIHSFVDLFVWKTLSGSKPCHLGQPGAAEVSKAGSLPLGNWHKLINRARAEKSSGVGGLSHPTRTRLLAVSRSRDSEV